MIQRIQTVYMLIAGILSIVLLCFPVLELFDNAKVMEVTMWGVKDSNGELLYSTWPLFFLTLLSCILFFVSILLYKTRMLQIRANIFNALIIAGTIIALVGYALILPEKYKGMNVAYNVYTLWILPVNIMLCIQAIRAIGKDEALVRSLDRLR